MDNKPIPIIKKKEKVKPLKSTERVKFSSAEMAIWVLFGSILIVGTLLFLFGLALYLGK